MKLTIQVRLSFRGIQRGADDAVRNHRDMAFGRGGGIYASLH